MKVEIKNRFTGNIMLCGEYESIKDCLQKNSGADLRGADLRGADLRGADLRGADLSGAYLRGADLRGAYLRGAYLSGADLREADLREAYLRGADLSGADLRGADLRGAALSEADLREAYLRGAYLRGAYLSGAKNYSESHDFFISVIRNQKLDYFTNPEWAIIGQIYIHRLCWDTIKKRYGEKAMTIFKKLSKVKFNEWEKRYKKVGA